jgi:HEAT repeats
MPVHESIPQLEPLRASAKELLRAFRADDPLARKRLRVHLRRKIALSERAGTPRVSLADALHVVAREAGYRSWPALVAAVRTTGDEVHAPLVGPAWRGTFVDGLVGAIVTDARSGDVEATIERMSGLPRRLGDAIRDRLASAGDLSFVVDVLAAGLSHPNARIRFESAGLLDHFADDRCVAPLRTLLHDPVPRVRRMALHALGRERCKLAPLPSNDDFVSLAVDQAVNDLSVVVRRNAVSELSIRLGDRRAVETMRSLMERETDATILRIASRALRRYANTASQPDHGGGAT